MTGSVCILCLKRFDGGTGDSGENGTNYQSRQLVPYIIGMDQVPHPEDTASPSWQTPLEQGHPFDLYSKFLLFTRRFLKVSVSDIFLQLAKEYKKSSGENIQAFCEICKDLVKHLCDLYAELQAVKLHLLNKVDELEKVTRLSMTSVSWKLGCGLKNSAVEQLHIRNVLQFNLYRQSLILNCQKRVYGGTPKVLIPRGLLPEYCKFPYSATFQSLMRLIIVYALGSSDQSSPVPLKEPEEELKIPAKQPKRRKKPRRRKIDDTDITSKKSLTVKVQLIDVSVKQEAGVELIDNGNSAEPGDGVVDGGVLDSDANAGDDHNNDSDWSRGSVSPSASIASEKEEKSIPRKRRKLRRTLKRSSYKDEFDSDEESEEKVETDQGFKRKGGRKEVYRGCYKCTICDREFSLTSSFANHVLSHNSVLEVTCTICDSKFQTARLHQLHMITMHKKEVRPGIIRNFGKRLRKYRKISCGPPGEFRSQSEGCSSSSKSKPFECRVCPAKFSWKSSLSKHAEEHENPQKINLVFHCEFCAKTFCSEDTFAEHLVEVHKEEFPCSICNTNYSTYPSLRTHLHSHETDEKNFWCHFCHQSYTNEQYWQVHQKMSHAGQDKLVCDQEQCTEEFLTTDQLEQHLKVHIREMGSTNSRKKKSGKEFPVHTCQTCGWSFLNKYSLTLHELVHLPYDECIGYKCPHPNCTSVMTKQSKLVRHYGIRHMDNPKPYQCEECNARFSHLVFFKKHVRCHEERKSGKTFTCDICDEVLLDSLSFNWHRHTHENPDNNGFGVEGRERKREKVSCDVCHEIYPSLARLKHHLESNHEGDGSEEDKKIQCNFCTLKFVQEQTHQLHMQVEHATYQNFICDAQNCNEEFDTHLALNDHLSNKHLCLEGIQEKKFIMEPCGGIESSTEQGSSEKLVLKVTTIHYCKVCNWGFVNPDFLQIHELRHIPRSGKYFPCPLCDHKFSDVIRLIRHYNVQHGKRLTLRQVKCPDCSNLFTDLKTLKSHQRHIHGKHQPKNELCCEQCRCTFVDISKYQRHLETQHPKGLQTCREEGCGKKFKLRDGLNRHLRVMHSRGEKYPCPVCGISFAYESEVIKHADDVHGPRKFECHICHKMFKRRYHLDAHIRRHDDTPKYICTECGKGYKEEMGLRWHMESIHTPDHLKRFGCPYCPYRTHRKLLFDSHLKTCTRNQGIPHVQDRSTVDKLPNSEAPPKKRRRRVAKIVASDGKEEGNCEETATQLASSLQHAQPHESIPS